MLGVAVAPVRPPDCQATDGTKKKTQLRRDRNLISTSGIGRILLGMTLAEVRRALPGAKFARTSDGDGNALVETTLARKQSVLLWADEHDPGLPIDWSRTIKTLETFSAAFHTAEGVHPGSQVEDVEKIFGRVKLITKSEIESREYVTFERQPDFLTLRLDYTGVFQNHSRETREYRPHAKILSMAVSMP
jgi:hypothetical protein